MERIENACCKLKKQYFFVYGIYCIFISYRKGPYQLYSENNMFVPQVRESPETTYQVEEKEEVHRKF
jgi:hypothetical protein